MMIDSWDLGNGLFELFGGCVIWLNVIRLHRDKIIKGVDWRVTGFFAVWGYWNIAYYWHLDQLFSWGAGFFVVSANTVWVIMAIYYRRNQ